ncbi:MAG: TraB/GumN family protein, partial [Povalibacter sp.]
PGPGLWKVWNGDHVLFILGTHSPLPRRLKWRSQEVELVITEAQQVIGKYSASFALEGGDLGTLRGPKLKKVLPRKSYREWQRLKKKYIGDVKDVETLWPVTAALVLRSAAFEQAGFDGEDRIWDEIERLALSYHVPVTIDHQVDTPVRLDTLQDAKSQQIGVDFLVNTIATVEANVRTARTAANAWSVGDVGALTEQAQAERSYADLYAKSWPFLTSAELQDLSARTDQRWLDAADQALHKNRTTFAAIPIFLLLQKDGVLSALRAKGYEVEAPH